MTTTINYIGHTFPGRKPRDLDDFRTLLRTEPLDPMWESYGNFAESWEGGIRFHGNFAEYSAAFSIDTDDQALITELLSLIRENQATPRYRDLRQARLEDERRRAKDAAERSDKLRRERIAELRKLTGRG